jgi:NAD-dependent SIR2 family protein deacetylase
MTKQSKTTIEPGDITAIEITCTHCGTVVSQKIEQWQNNMPQCPTCNTSWMPHRQSLIYAGDIVMRLRHLALLPKEDPRPNISVRFEVRAEEKA